MRALHAAGGKGKHKTRHRRGTTRRRVGMPGAGPWQRRHEASYVQRAGAAEERVELARQRSHQIFHPCSLANCSQACGCASQHGTARPRRSRLTLAGLPTFCPIIFHLLFSYSLMACNREALYASQHLSTAGRGGERTNELTSSCANSA